MAEAAKNGNAPWVTARRPAAASCELLYGSSEISLSISLSGHARTVRVRILP
jgi:hypothetical protein